MKFLATKLEPFFTDTTKLLELTLSIVKKSPDCILFKFIKTTGLKADVLPQTAEVPVKNFLAKVTVVAPLPELVRIPFVALELSILLSVLALNVRFTPNSDMATFL